MVKAHTKAEDSRKPKHSRDASRPSKGGKGQRDAATVRQTSVLCRLHALVEGGWLRPYKAILGKRNSSAGPAPQNVQQDSKEGQDREDPTSGAVLTSSL